MSVLENHPELRDRLTQWEGEAPEGVRAEIEVLRTGDLVHQHAAVKRLTALGPAARGAILALMQSWTQPRPHFDARRSGDGDLPARAAHAIACVGEPGLEALGAALEDPQEAVRLLAVQALRSSGDGRAFAWLLRALDDESVSVRLLAIRGLRVVARALATRSLIDLFRADGGAEMLKEVAPDLAGSGESAALNVLVEALGDEKLRRIAATALADVGDKRARAPMLAFVAGGDLSVLDALDRFEPSWRESEAGAQALGQAVTHFSADLLARPDEAPQAIEALGTLGDRRGLEALLVALRAPGSVDRMSAIEAIEKLRGVTVAELSVAIEPIRTALRDAIENGDRNLLDAASKMLRGLEDPSAVDALITNLSISVLTQQSSLASDLAAEMLATRVGPEDARAIGPLIANLRGADPLVRDHALRALKRITGLELRENPEELPDTAVVEVWEKWWKEQGASRGPTEGAPTS